jgi:hypothetical protein
VTYSDGVTDGIRRERTRCASIANERAAIWKQNRFEPSPAKATEAETIAREILATEKTYPVTKRGRKMTATTTREEIVVETAASAAPVPAERKPDREVLPSKAATEREPRPRRTRSEEKQMVSEIASAIAKITAECGPVAKRGENKFHGYRYATMGDVLLQVTPLLAKNGLVIMQTETERSMFDEGRVLAVQYEFTIAHSSGEVWSEKPRQTGVCRCRDSKGGWDDKSFNKAHTAARKYFLLALFQIATSDDEDADEDKGQQRTWGPRGGSRAPTNPEPSKIKPLTPEAIQRSKRNTAIVEDGWKRGQSMHESIPNGISEAELDAKYEKIDQETGEIIEKPAVPKTGGPAAVTTSHVVSATAEPGAGSQPAPEAPVGSSPPAGASDALDEVLNDLRKDIARTAPYDQVEVELERLIAAAREGMMKLRAVWTAMPSEYRAPLEGAKERLKKIATLVDERHDLFT